MRPPASSRTVPAGISFLAMATSSAGLSTMATSVIAQVAMNASLGPSVCRRIYRPPRGIARLRVSSLGISKLDGDHRPGHIPWHEPTVPSTPKTQYTKSRDVHIAYQVSGRGPFDLVFVPGFVSHLEYWWEYPDNVRFFERLGSFSRLICFDKRGTGLSDRIGDIPTLEQRMDDVRAVMDAAGSERAVLFGVSEGGPLSLLFAATYPERTSALVVYGSYARRAWAADHPFGKTAEERTKVIETLEREWA